jgi:ABC-type antimicrobial peptide transport system permease subunit
MAKVGHERQIHLPFRDAFKIALRSLKIRFWRAIITTLGIVLAIAFLSSVLTSAAISTNLKLVSDELPAQRIWVVVMSLLVCVVGITNSMLMAVTERYKEIGTMKCLGALDRFVIELFLLESSLQGFIGSLIGAFVGSILMLFIHFQREGAKVFGAFKFFSSFSLSDVGWIILLCVGVGVGLSVIGALYPSYRAAKMVPADAMRVEI